MSRAKIQIDLDEVEKFAQACDNEEEIAEALGISYSTLKNRKRDFAEFASAIKRGKCKANVFVGGKLIEAIKKGNITAIIFYLKSRCGWKETDRREITGKDGEPLKVENTNKIDLSHLSVKELETLEGLLYAADSDPSGNKKG